MYTKFDLRGLLYVCSILALCSAGAQASEPEFKKLSEADVVSEVQALRQADLLKLSKPFIVKGEVRFDGWFIKTDKLVFEPGAALIFTSQALDSRRNFFVVAEEIVSLDASSPGKITYERRAIPVASAKPGQGPTGTHATVDGRAGGAGGPGETGVMGATGFVAPSLTIATLSVPGSGPLVDLSGGNGGRGGQGQKGGDGGNGRKGTPASQSMFDCKAGGGRGGNGGPGGSGGKGGTGGKGGDGGSLTILSSASLLPVLSQKFRVVLNGGQLGTGGDPGRGGIGGAAGPGGQDARPYCGGGSAGSPGNAGGPGRAGKIGTSGQSGDMFVGVVDPNHFGVVFD